MIIKNMIIKCSNCNKQDNMILNWNEFKLPFGWKYRTRSFNSENKPEEIQIVCSNKCADELEMR